MGFSRKRSPLLFHVGLCLVGLIIGTVVAPADAAVDPELRAVLAWQVALEAEGFSPGIIDGKPGKKTQMATAAFQRSQGLAATGWLDDDTAYALGVDEINPLVAYTVSDADERQITGATTDWNERAAMPYLGYEAMSDAVAERFHCTKALLARLNPELDLDAISVGESVVGPAVLPAAMPSVANLQVHLDQKVIRAFNANGRLVALFHCSVAAMVAHRPSGATVVRLKAANPGYTFNPASWPEVKNVDRILSIPPGPRSPVGLFWIGLDLPGYGIHGTPWPELIGKTGSHGCIRLTNWDAVRLGKMVSVGMPVQFVVDRGSVAQVDR